MRASIHVSMDEGGAVVRLQGACDSETPALGAFVIVARHDVIRRLDFGMASDEQSPESRSGGRP